MPNVTALEPQAHDPERVNVYLDGKFAFGLSAEVVVRRGLRVGDTYDATTIAEIERDEEQQRAHAAALNFLSYRPRSGREIEQYLRKRGTEPGTIEAVVTRLLESGLVDDREFARFWVDNRQTFRPRGTRALRSEMRQKGLDTEVIDEVLESLPDEEEAAYAASAARVNSLSKTDDKEFSRRMLGFLQRRGFPYAASAAAVKRRLAERGAESTLLEE